MKGAGGKRGTYSPGNARIVWLEEMVRQTEQRWNLVAVEWERELPAAEGAARQGMVSLEADLPYIGDPSLKVFDAGGGPGISLGVVIPVQHLAVCPGIVKAVVTKRARPKISNGQRL